MNILVVGATSDIAMNLARLYTHPDNSIFLLARDGSRLEQISNDLAVRLGKPVEFSTFDICEIREHELIIEKASSFLGNIDLVLIAIGLLPENGRNQKSAKNVISTIDTNFTYLAAFLVTLTTQLEKQGGVQIVTITSVAGDVGKKSNYVYGAAKSGLSTLIQGLQHEYAKSGVILQDIKPGIIETRMTSHMKRNFLFADVETTAHQIKSAITKGRRVAYIPGYWRLIMFCLKAMPRKLLERTNL